MIKAANFSNRLTSSNNLDFDTLIDNRDSVCYTTLKIGTKIWVIENLRFKSEGFIINPNNLSIK